MEVYKILVKTIKYLVEHPAPGKTPEEKRNDILRMAEQEDCSKELQEFLSWFGH